AIAFYCLWTGQRLPHGTAATGKLDTRRHIVDKVSSETLAAKVLSWQDQFEDAGAIVLVPASQRSELEGGQGVTAADSVVGALAALGLERRACVTAEGQHDVKQRAARLRHLVETQAVEARAHVEGINGWLLHAEEMLVLIDGLHGEP